jgi:excisionase family DNA binding protein
VPERRTRPVQPKMGKIVFRGGSSHKPHGRIHMDEFISPKELSALLKCSKPFPYMLVKRGKLPYYKIGNLVRFKKSEIDAFLEKCRVKATEKKLRQTKERRANRKEDAPPLSKSMNIEGAGGHSLVSGRTGGICARCSKRTDGKIDYLKNGLCGRCRQRASMRKIL